MFGVAILVMARRWCPWSAFTVYRFWSRSCPPCERFLLLWILVVQFTSYGVGAISWIYAERSGFKAFGLYMQRFARENRERTKLLNEKPSREQVEPFLTGETFHIFFELVYELEHDLRMFLALIFNLLVFASEIDGTLPLAYGSVFAVLLTLQWTFRRRVAEAYLRNQRVTNRMTAHGYTAWDNVFTGNRYNLRLWMRGFKHRLREALGAQIGRGLEAGFGHPPRSVRVPSVPAVCTFQAINRPVVVGRQRASGLRFAKPRVLGSQRRSRVVERARRV